VSECFTSNCRIRSLKQIIAPLLIFWSCLKNEMFKNCNLTNNDEDWFSLKGPNNYCWAGWLFWCRRVLFKIRLRILARLFGCSVSLLRKAAFIFNRLYTKIPVDIIVPKVPWHLCDCSQDFFIVRALYQRCCCSRSPKAGSRKSKWA